MLVVADDVTVDHIVDVEVDGDQVAEPFGRAAAEIHEVRRLFSMPDDTILNRHKLPDCASFIVHEYLALGALVKHTQPIKRLRPNNGNAFAN